MSIYPPCTMKSSEILRAARKEIEERRAWPVCCAVESQTKNQLHPLIQTIQASINRGLVSFWLPDLYSETYDYIRNHPTKSYDEMMQEYRLAWIDWMIEGYERVGD